ncbi:MAG TPA: hypothetical protein VFP65_18150 [Anaeromyxobacteraceae bacterium]|nr:hypothetical protein [Anaeromyxobacteraceae bacterium]
MTRTWKGAVALAVLAAACAGHRSGEGDGPRVADADLGRLAPEQMQPVDDARRYLASARDELARAKLRQQDLTQEAALSKADQEAAEALRHRAEANAKAADASRAPAQVEQARQMQEQAKLAKSAADARADWAAKASAARQAGVRAAEQQVRLGDARVEEAKLRALQAASIPAATKYDAARFQEQVQGAQRAFDDALKKTRDLDGQATASQQRWQDLQKQLQARGTAVPTG